MKMIRRKGSELTRSKCENVKIRKCENGILLFAASKCSRRKSLREKTSLPLCLVALLPCCLVASLPLCLYAFFIAATAYSLQLKAYGCILICTFSHFRIFTFAFGLQLT